MTKNVRVCVLNARKSKKRFCCYLNDDFDCTAPTYEYDYCIGFLKSLRRRSERELLMKKIEKHFKLILEKRS